MDETLTLQHGRLTMNMGVITQLFPIILGPETHFVSAAVKLTKVRVAMATFQF